MQLLGRTEFTSIEHPDSLEFMVVQEYGWLEKVLIPLIVASVIVMLWRAGQVIFAAIAMLSTSAYFVANWIHGPATRLRVTKDELTTQGNLNKLFRTELRVSTSGINSLRWDSGGENGTSGLYVIRGWGMTLVLPGINKEQAEAIRDKIAARFPDFPVSDRFRKESGLITLGLSKPTPED